MAKLYTPAQFGEFSLYFALLGLSVKFSSFRLDSALLLPRDQQEGESLLALSLLSSFIFFIIVLIAVSFASLRWGIYLAVSVLCGSWIQILSSWVIREKKYRLVGGSRALRGIGSSHFSILFSFHSLGLIIGHVAGTLLSSIHLLIYSRNSYGRKIPSWSIMKSALGRYRDFPQVGFLSSVLSSVSSYAPYLILGYFVERSMLGYFLVATRVLEMPIAMLGEALYQVYYRKIVEYEKLIDFFLRATAKIVVMVIFIYGAIILFMPVAIEYFFDAHWRELISLINVLVPLYLVRFIVVSQSSIFLRTRKLKDEVYINILLVIAQVIIPIILFLQEVDPLVVIRAFSWGGILVYLFMGLMLFWRSKEKLN